MTNQQIEKARKERETIKKLSDCKNILKIIAKKCIEINGAYFCTIEGLKTEIVLELFHVEHH